MKIKDFKLERFFAKYEFNTPYLLSSSDCESFTVAELLALEEGAEEQFKNLRLGYTESRGNPELRAEISKLYDNVKPEEILIFSGAEEGIFVFMNVLLEPGDHIIVQRPAYQSLYAVAEAIGCRVTAWEMKPENGWNPDLGLLKKSIIEKKTQKQSFSIPPTTLRASSSPKKNSTQSWKLQRQKAFTSFRTKYTAS